MKLLRRKEGPSLDTRLAALLEAAELGTGRLPEAAVSAARAVAERAGARRDLSVEHTAVALAGATGSGKSSLFNVLAGTDLAAVGVTRPTTATAQAALWDGAGAGPLLDWLSVPRRHAVGERGESGQTGRPSGGLSGGLSGGPDVQGEQPGDLSGLILLDLPDHDSIELAHRLEVNRLVELVDLLVWVLDPQKYADAAVHDRYLRPLSRHRDVTVVVLNQIDRLPRDAVNRCLADLRRLLDEDGLAGVPVLGASARTGAGLPELRALLAERVTRHRSWASRLAADVATAADVLAAACSPTAPSPGIGTPGTGALGIGVSGSGGSGTDRPGTGAPGTGKPVSGLRAGRLTTALSEAAGVPLVVEAVEKGHRHRAVVATGWPVTRWLRRFRPDPLRRLHLGTVKQTGAHPERASWRVTPGEVTGARSGEVAGRGSGRSGTGEVVGRTSVPVASAVQKAQVGTAIRDVGERAAQELPAPWAASVRQAARSRTDELADALDRAVATTSLGATRRPRWWRVVGALQWLVFAAMMAGALWLGALFGMEYLRLPEPPTPTAGELPWPTTLLLGGAVAGMLVALLARLAAWAGGRRRARQASRALRASIAQVGDEYVLGPVETELDRYARFTEALAQARA
ncbi:GTPase [Nonomuraea sp. NPDC005983]|uniref:GTPase n=1 Tax=Nonomuraea sp. NPDC005983 TaxID=3155595 RepID=UPI0033BDA0B1